MDRRQKKILTDFAVVVIITFIAIIAIINFKDYVNWSETMKAMEQLGRIALDYREKHRSLPSEDYIADIKEELEGKGRIGNIHYRARWIGFDAEPNETLAYAKKDYHSLIMHTGYIVLRLDGQVEWFNQEKFEKILKEKQSQLERDVLTR